MRLDTVRVLDLTRLLPGPYATQLLADLGADVVKVEDPEVGDYGRNMPPLSERSVGTTFESVNRGKRSVAIDLKSGEGRRVFYRLVEDADVVFEGFRPGVVDRLGIDYETLRTYNEDIVYCSLTGYGQTGPYADRVGHDITYAGLGGLVDMTRENEEAPPQLPGYPIGDLGGGLFSAFAIVSGLLSREFGNGGDYIDVSMTDIIASFSQPLAYQALVGDDPRPVKTTLTGKYPCYDVYETSDGQYMSLAALEPKFWRTFCAEVGREDLVDAHMSDDPAEREALREELSDLFAERPRDEWTERLGHETMTAPVLKPEETVDHPQLDGRIVERPDDAPPRVGFPASGPGLDGDLDESLPGHGEHTRVVLSEAGFTDEEISDLHDYGVTQ
jgi:crotonobetainyl-CoA:carnitine CoA-transferase CaiB-like acyl-CoA transferase